MDQHDRGDLHPLPLIGMQGWSLLSGWKSQGPHLADGVTLGVLLSLHTFKSLRSLLWGDPLAI